MKKKYKKYKEATIPVNIKELIKFMMKDKKIYEVTNIMHFLLPKITKHNIDLIIDIGCGQGYISYILAGANPNIRIYGIDSKKSNIAAFRKRIKEVSIQHKHRISVDPEIYISHFYLEEMYVNNDSIINIKKSIKEKDIPMLITLHGCGNLSSTLIRMFVNVKSIKSLFLISCCFNLLTESVSEEAKETSAYKLYSEHVKNDLTIKPSDLKDCEGYPMSEYMTKNYSSFFLGRIIRYSAAASFSFLLEESDRNLSYLKMIYRSAFEVFQ